MAALGGFSLVLPETASIGEPHKVASGKLRRASKVDGAAATEAAVNPASAWGKIKGKVKNTIECNECGAQVWSAARYCPSCGASTSRDRKSTVESITTRQRTMTRDTCVSTVSRESLGDDENPENYRNDLCCFCAKRIMIDEEYCPLDDEREVDGPKLHPGCWDDFFADMDTNRCEWCYQEVVADRGGVQDGFKPRAGLDTSKMKDNKFGANGHWGRAHAMGANVPQGGAGGPVLGANRRVLHQWCVEAYNEKRGNSCLHCGKPVHLGLDVEGVGKVHKGFCFNQVQIQLAEERKAALEALSKAERDEYTCATCGELIDPESEYIELDNDGGEPGSGTRKIHLKCWSTAQCCVHCKKTIEVDEEYYEVEGGLCKVGCYEEWRAAKAPKCIHCGTAVTGKHYKLEEGPCKIECYEAYVKAHPPPAPEPSSEAGGLSRLASQEGEEEEVSHRGRPTYGMSRASRMTGRLTMGTSCKSDSPEYDLGWMWKRGRLVPSWKRRWAIIRSGCLCYFADADGLVMKGSIELAGCTARTVDISSKDAPRALGAQVGFEVIHPSHVLLAFPADSLPSTKEEAAPWVLSINEAIEEADLAAADRDKAAQLKKEQEELSRISKLEVGGEAEDENVPEADSDRGQGEATDTPAAASARPSEPPRDDEGHDGEAQPQASVREEQAPAQEVY